MRYSDLNELKSNKLFLLTISIIGIILLGYVGINLYTASIVPVTDTSVSYVKIPAYKQDGSRNMEVITGLPHTLEIYWSQPFVNARTTPPIGYWFYLINVESGESYRSQNIPYNAAGYYTIEMTNVSRLDEWTINYWVDGTNSDIEWYNGIIEGGRFSPFIEYNTSRETPYCDGTTYYYDAVFYMGEVTFTKEFDSYECGWEPDPCIGVTCEDYCVGTTLYTNGTCLSDGQCGNFDTEINSLTCNYIAPTSEPTEEPGEEPTEVFNEPDGNETLIDTILDIFKPDSTPEPIDDSSSSSEASTSLVDEEPTPEEVITESEDRSRLDDLLEWLRELVAGITGNK